ncbi:MAG: argB [Acidobacteria bacterium]|nr:argB [Acidobacteriota bacterium]
MGKTNMNDITVIKLGGSLLDDAGRRAGVLRAVADYWNSGAHVVVVHGGGKHIDAQLARLGIARKIHAGLRVTDDATLDVVVSVLAGTVNKWLVAELTAAGVRAAGFSGSDAGTVVAERHPPIDGVELGHVGRVVCSNRVLIRSMLAAGILPVISSIAQGPAGTLLNVNADSAASAIAAALAAKSLLFVTDVPGLKGADGIVVDELTPLQAETLLASEIVSGGMRPKLLAALSAISAGVSRVAIGDAIHEGTGGTHLVAA